jgi:hypothetical protein
MRSAGWQASSRCGRNSSYFVFAVQELTVPFCPVSNIYCQNYHNPFLGAAFGGLLYPLRGPSL